MGAGEFFLERLLALSSFTKKVRHGYRTFTKKFAEVAGLSGNSLLPVANFSGKKRPENALFHL
jgi:hypothetical protein